MAASVQKTDWERFRSLGTVPPSIREVVLRSWLRSRDNPVLGQLQRAPLVGLDTLEKMRARSGRLYRAAGAALQRTGYLLNDAGAMVLLCNPSGVVLEASGDPQVRTKGEENHLYPGGHWQENNVGTNAIGTALHLGKPVSISGTEHFCEAIQHWSCAATPIRDPRSGRLLGAVDISAPSGIDLSQGAALSASLAAQIEEALGAMALSERQILMDHLLAQRRVGDAACALLDVQGNRIWASESFGEALTRIAPGVASETQNGDEDVVALAGRMRQALPEADVELISQGGAPLGLMVHLPVAPTRRTRPEISLEAIAATGPGVAAICTQARQLIGTGVALVLKGPAGSGKETLARALHDDSPLAGCPFEVVDCSLLDAAVLQAGAVSPAAQSHGRVEKEGGTLVLDEPAETPAAAQASLAQILAHLAREGRAPVQLISLSSAVLSEKMQTGQLRPDLYFRLSGAVLRLPALTDRRTDLPELIRIFAAHYSDRGKGAAIRFTPAAMLRLQTHDWPGNLRELRNLIESVSATSFSRLVDVADLPASLVQPQRPARADRLRERERADILDTIAECGGNMTETARRLGISRSTLYVKLEQYGVPRGRRH